MKDDKQVIREFNKVVNMTADELEKWLESSKSSQAGWPKEDGSGESVGHESGRKITAILKSNSDKRLDKYTDDQIKHMRNVVAYCNRHLAQEKGSLENKSTAEAKNSKSYISLKNWGHDPLKNDKETSRSNKENTTENKNKGQPDQTGGKRKQSSSNQDGASKKRETRQSAAKRRAKDGDENDDSKADYEEDESDQQKGKGKKAPKPGDTVSWNWGQGQPQGKVLDVKEKDASVITKRGSKVS